MHPTIFYQQSIHHIASLILLNKFQRALNIIKHLQNQGIHSAQLVVMGSYCVKMTRGVGEAIRELDDRLGKGQREGERDGERERGPLIQIALGQYYREAKNNKQCQKHISNIINQSQSACPSKHPTPTILSQIHKSLNPPLPPIYCPQQLLKTTQSSFVNPTTINTINKINKLVLKYKQNDIQQKQMKEELENIQKQMQKQGEQAPGQGQGEVEGKIKIYLSRFRKYLDYRLREIERDQQLEIDQHAGK